MWDTSSPAQINLGQAGSQAGGTRQTNQPSGPGPPPNPAASKGHGTSNPLGEPAAQPARPGPSQTWQQAKGHGASSNPLGEPAAQPARLWPYSQYDSTAQPVRLGRTASLAADPARPAGAPDPEG